MSDDIKRAAIIVANNLIASEIDFRPLSPDLAISLGRFLMEVINGAPVDTTAEKYRRMTE